MNLEQRCTQALQSVVYGRDDRHEHTRHVSRAAARPGEGGTHDNSEDPSQHSGRKVCLITDTVHTTLLHPRVGGALRLGCGGF